MRSRGLTDVRTFNPKHFNRFDDLEVDGPNPDAPRE